MEQMKALEEKAASAECANRKAEEDLKRMKKLILKGGVLPSNISTTGSDSLFVDDDETTNAETDKFSLSKSKRKSKRRHSDGVINEFENGDLQNNCLFSSPSRGGNVTKLQARTEMKPKKKSKPTAHILSSALTDDIDIGLLREALAAKSSQAASLKVKLKEAAKQAQAAMKKLQHEHGEKEMLRLAKQELASQVSTLASDKEFVVQEQDIIM
eukprot:CAMPEP_0172571500 /NCGR_PEP_ID=MMETSP1067-20121228/131423_1 /TAXON_ID=265564 ORGANISM="Thalassiosira punctigera, Strain Tpunct2005C2" /NCGR_SAMPLE_ID=MMETSP1067 /ASSEMBLY_ACC=CAM_ASM_000444 /LENGTH=212 /DNA_ID=CAMNT_0013363821 /DNA_START=6 /DNA_END=641 /DNA_ORIENTATION=-